MLLKEISIVSNLVKKLTKKQELVKLEIILLLIMTNILLIQCLIS